MDTSTQIERRVVLVRHGRSAHVHAGWINVEGFQSWRAAYEAAGIMEGERPPAPLGQLAAAAALIVSSDAPRAMATARLLANGREVVVSPLLREMELEPPVIQGIRLPLVAWVLVVGLRTVLLTVAGRYPSEREAARIQGALEWLEQLSKQHALVVVVTHASFRQQVAKWFRKRGWRAGPGRRSMRNWSDWHFQRDRPPG